MAYYSHNIDDKTSVWAVEDPAIREILMKYDGSATIPKDGTLSDTEKARLKKDLSKLAFLNSPQKEELSRLLKEVGSAELNYFRFKGNSPALTDEITKRILNSENAREEVIKNQVANDGVLEPQELGYPAITSALLAGDVIVKTDEQHFKMPFYILASTSLELSSYAFGPNSYGGTYYSTYRPRAFVSVKGKDGKQVIIDTTDTISDDALVKKKVGYYFQTSQGLCEVMINSPYYYSADLKIESYKVWNEFGDLADFGEINPEKGLLFDKPNQEKIDFRIEFKADGSIVTSNKDGEIVKTQNLRPDYQVTGCRMSKGKIEVIAYYKKENRLAEYPIYFPIF